MSRGITLGIADGTMLVDGEVAYVAKGLKVTLASASASASETDEG
jgi:hypothetical protein